MVFRMIRLARIPLAAALLAVFGIVSTAYAGNAGTRTIAKMNVRSTQGDVKVFAQDEWWNDPNNCNDLEAGSGRGEGSPYVLLQTSNPLFDQIYSALLAAQCGCGPRPVPTREAKMPLPLPHSSRSSSRRRGC